MPSKKAYICYIYNESTLLLGDENLFKIEVIKYMHKRLLHALAIVVLCASSTAFSMNRRARQYNHADRSLGWYATNTPIIPAAFTLGSLVAHAYNRKDTATFCGMAALVATIAMPDSKVDL